MIKGWYTQHENNWHQIEDVKDTGIPAHKPGSGNVVKLKGKDEWVHASKLKGLEPKPPITKSEAMAKLKSLSKNTGKSPTHSDSIRAIADSYAKKKGLDLNHNTGLAQVDPAHASNVAKAYHNMKHDPNHPEVKQSYQDLINETIDQYNHITSNSGIKFSKMTPGMENPYKTSHDLFHDVRNNGHMWYYPTESGFGSDGSSNYSDHPMLQDVNVGGQTMKANDLFRVVHDYFGHAKEGFSFGPRGEESAYQHHKQMYSPSAQKALTSETKGQNSWVNFGPHGENNRKNPSNTIYADQKAGILPDWAMGGKMTKSETISKLRSLSKGVAQKKWPYNPRAEESVKEFKGDNKPREWIHGHLSPQSRNSWPKIEGNARQRALHKLSGMTEVKKDPETGKRSFLLHRGVSPQEKKRHVDEKTNTTTHKDIMSWTPDHSVATQFSNDPNMNHTLSAWVHEDNIHAVPFQTGVHAFGINGKKHTHEPLSRRLKDEKEILVSGNHKLEDPQVAFKLAIPHSDYDSLEGETTYPVQGDDGYFDDKEQASLNTRINQKMTKSEAISKLRDLAKGSAQRKLPFNPKRDVDDNQYHSVSSWTEDEDFEGKLNIPRMEGNMRKRAIQRLHAKTKSRKNPETGEAEFLLHRGLTDSNHEFGLDDYPSFTPYVGLAADFADENELSERNIISSWVPESKIHHIPHMVGSSRGYKLGPAEYGHEHEVIVDNTGGHIDHHKGQNAEVTPVKEVSEKFANYNPDDIHSRINYKKYRIGSKGKVDRTPLRPQPSKPLTKKEAYAKLQSLRKDAPTKKKPL